MSNPVTEPTLIKRSPVATFIMTFAVLAILTIVQSQVLSRFVTEEESPIAYRITMTIYWVIVAAAFTFLTRWQIVKNYEQPMRRLAEATKAVAGGDFSVYVRPLHSADRADYMDAMIKDFNKMVEELGSIETLKTEFLSNISHEIRTPLSVIQNYAELLAKGDVPDTQIQEYSNRIRESTKKLSGLVTNILKLNRLEQQTIPVPQFFDLPVQLSECALLFESMWEKKGIVFEADLEDSLIFHGDASLLAIVWNNLLSNAIKYTDSGGRVRLTQCSDTEKVSVTVEDSGCGMTAETLAHIFDKFYQGDTSRAVEGNGLGLPLLQRVLQICGGSIAVRSEVGQGSEFIVHLPLQAEKEKEHA